MLKLVATLQRIDTQKIAQQFKSLDGRHPGLWPIFPRLALMAGLVAAMILLGWVFYWSELVAELDEAVAVEVQLKEQYVEKMKQAVNLESLLNTRSQVMLQVGQLEKQLPSRAEMDALLSDINQAGVGRGASLRLFRPGEPLVREYYAELPIAVQVVGGYHDLAAFASDIANLPRIVTLNDLTISQPADLKPLLMLEAIAKTYRYLDPDEAARQQGIEGDKNKQGGE